MQEDKLYKWLASQLRKQQEENPLPYELGAWEAFEKKRVSVSGKKAGYYWISGIAASIALFLVVSGVWLFWDSKLPTGDLPSDQIAMEEKVITPDPQSPDSSQEKLIEIEKENVEEIPPMLGLNEKGSIKKPSPNPDLNSTEETIPKTLNNKISGEDPSKVIEKLAEVDPKTLKENNSKTEISLPLIASEEKVVEPVKTEVPEKVIAETELPKDPQLSDEEIKEILESKSFASIVMGLSPGFGAAQSSNQATSGTSLGLGVMVDMELTRKLVMGSGVAFNYLNQASESQVYAQIAGFSEPITEKNEIAQVQVDIPLYFKYPITRSRSISVQAGFSNLLTFNQYSEQKSSYTRQVAVLDAFSAGSNSFTLKSESVNQSSTLAVAENRFYPFATANLGVNIRLFESKKTTFEVMPFYNYPLQEFSGYGEKLGMFGASFKVNFGANPKK